MTSPVMSFAPSSERQERRRRTDIVDAYEAPRGRRGLGFVHHLVEFGNTRSRARHQRTRRNRMYPDAFGTEFGRDIAHGSFQPRLRNPHDVVVFDHHLAAVW
jgi:hypothetical protein